MTRWFDWIMCIRDHGSELPPDVRHVLLVLATYANAEGRCHPSLRTLADSMGLKDARSARWRVRRAIQRGWLVKEGGGRWKGDPPRWRITPQGCVHAKGVATAPLATEAKGVAADAKGGRGVRAKGVSRYPRTSMNVQEPAGPSPVVVATGPARDKRRELARAIRDSKEEDLRRRFVATFNREYGHLYGRTAA
jgi:hypothetical protein